MNYDVLPVQRRETWDVPTSASSDEHILSPCTQLSYAYVIERIQHRTTHLYAFGLLLPSSTPPR